MLINRRHILLILFEVFDLALLVGAFIASAVPRLSEFGATSLTDFLSMRISVRNFVLFSGLLWLWHLLFYFFGLYESRRFSKQRREAIDVAKATSLGTLALLVVGTAFNLSMIHATFLISFWLVSTGTSVLSREALRLLLKKIRQHGRNLRHVVIVGTNPRAIELAGDLESNSTLGYRILGFVDREWEGLETFRKTGHTCISDFKDFPSLIRNSVVDEVMISLPISSLYSEISRIAALCEEQGITTHILFSPFDLKQARAKGATSDYDSLITLHGGTMQGWAPLIKRVLDTLLSLLCLILFAPFLLMAAALVKLSSPGPIFFVQKRVGLNKRLISVYKFRTMVTNAEQEQADLEHLNEVGGPVFKIKDDPRITGIGKFLRKSSIDELPQLFNVLKGDMSLVGPRPLPVRDYRGFHLDWQRRRFSIRPGITCLWQINGRSSVSFERWMEMDLEYIDRWSVWLDLQILIRTIPAVLKGSGAA
jgi:exopolysaccharide biosynthesis polyprenyl glycosylphosphotransferase